MQNICPQKAAVPHGVKVFIGAFLIASQLKPKSEKNCITEISDKENNKNLMEPPFKLAPYNYKLNSDAPLSSFEIGMMVAKEEFLSSYDARSVTVPKDEDQSKSELNIKIHYDYGKIFTSS